MVLGFAISVMLILAAIIVWPARSQLLHVRALAVNEEDLRVLMVKTWLQSRIGLLNHLSLAPSEALAFRVGRTITTFGMHFPIDIVFLDKRYCVLKIEANVEPNRLIKSPSAALAIETAAGCAQRYFNVGRTINFQS